MSTLQEVLEIWRSDLEFQEECRINLEATLAKRNIELSPTDLQKFKKSFQQTDDGDLEKRINK